MTTTIGGLGRTPLLVAHILLLVSWLGVDVGVFYASVHLRRAGLSAETRLVTMQMMTGLDKSARVSLILLVPISVGLAWVTGNGLHGVGSGTAGVTFWLLLAAALVWVYLFVRAGRVQASTGPDDQRVWRSVNLAVHVAVMLFFGYTAVASLAGVHAYWSHFVALKALIFAVLVALGLSIELTLREIGPAFADLINGETAVTLGRFDAAIRRGYVPVLLIYSGLIAIVVISVSRP
jgi:hypothetical protein